MTEPIEFFFDVVSPFGWFSAERVGGLPRSHARTVAWRPLLLGVTITQAACRPCSKLLCVPKPKRERIGDEVRQECCVNL